MIISGLMTQPPLHPSRPLKWAAILTRALLWAVLGVWMTVGLAWGAIHFFIVPRIGEWRGELETLATRTVGVSVRIGHIEAETQGLIPSFALSDVRLLDPQGRDALVLKRVIMALSAKSLLSGGLEQIHIDQPTLDVRRTATGGLLVAGLDLWGGPTEADADNPAADWFFSQAEFAIRSGTLRWTDDLRQQPTLALADVDLVVRNPGRQHLLRLDATPQDQIGQRFTLQGVFTSPFLSMRPGQLSDWSGTAHAHLPAVDVARLSAPAALAERFGLTVQQGVGALQLWVDVKNGQPTGGTADLALTGVHARFTKAIQPLSLARLTGRVNLALGADSISIDTQNLTFDTEQGTHWAQGDMSLKLFQYPEHTRGELQANRIHLAALHDISAALPLAPEQQARLATLDPKGEMTALKLNWREQDGLWSSFSAQGKVTHLALAPGETPPTEPLGPGESARHVPGRPGLAGAAVDFDLNQDGGQAKVSMGRGWLSFPGVFEDPLIPLDQLSGDVRWQLKGADVAVQVANLRLANADLQGQASAQWHTSDPATSPSGGRLPGVLKLDGVISRGKAERVHRYVPLVIGPVAKNYVKEAILSGKTSNVRFRLAGDLWQVPFANPGEGEFKVVAQISGVDFAFIPPGFSPAEGPHWPALKQVAGELVFDRTSMTVHVARGNVADAPALRVSQGKAHIANLQDRSVVEVNAQIDGPLNQALGVVRRSPLAVMTAQALSTTTGTGNASIHFGLSVPLYDTLKTQVKGRVSLAGNDLQITPHSPLLGRARGTVDFNETGFQVTQATAQLLGGELSFSGGLRPDTGGGTVQFSGQGTATAAGLSQAAYLGLPSALVGRTQGATTYAVQLAFNQGWPEWAVQSSLTGLTVDLPAPMAKTADQNWALRYQSRKEAASAATPGNRESVQLGFSTNERTRGLVSFSRTVGEAGAQIERGLVFLGPSDAPMPPAPAKGMIAHLMLPSFDADAWLAALDMPPNSGVIGTPGNDATDQWVPDRVHLDTDRLQLAGRSFHKLKLNANAVQLPSDSKRQRWQANVQAQELAGSLTYTAPHAPGLPQAPGTTDTRDGQLTARLQRLALNTQAENSVPPPFATRMAQAATLPALDVEVDRFTLDGRDLGQLSLDATNRTSSMATAPREWLLHKLVLRVPEARLTASGSWAQPSAQEQGPTPHGDPRRTQLTVALDIEDSGALLQRFGMPGVFRGGNGSLKGSLGWQGMPSRLNTASLDGQLKLELASGQFLKADPGLAKLLGVLSLQSLPRRLTLDFSDVFAQGFAFDFVRGDARIEQGVVHTNNLQMKGPNAAVLMEGEADISRETQHIRAVVVPELNAGTASLIATVINPAVGLGTFLAQAMLRQPLISASSQSFLIHGPWANPQVDKVPSLTPAEPTETTLPRTGTTP